MTILLSILLVVSVIYNLIQAAQKHELATELIASDDCSGHLESATDALTKSNYLMSLSGNGTFYGQIKDNTKLLEKIERDNQLKD